MEVNGEVWEAWEEADGLVVRGNDQILLRLLDRVYQRWAVAQDTKQIPLADLELYLP